MVWAIEQHKIHMNNCQGNEHGKLFIKKPIEKKKKKKQLEIYYCLEDLSKNIGGSAHRSCACEETPKQDGIGRC